MPRGGEDVELYGFLNLGARWGWVVNVKPWPLYPPGKTQYPSGGHQDQSGRVQKILPQPGFDPQTVQPIASRYTD
jgi:hypothetical protein